MVNLTSSGCGRNTALSEGSFRSAKLLAYLEVAGVVELATRPDCEGHTYHGVSQASNVTTLLCTVHRVLACPVDISAQR